MTRKLQNKFSDFLGSIFFVIGFGAQILVQGVYVFVGLVCVVIGVIGIKVPGLPTVPFLLVSVWCFRRGSPRLYGWTRALPQIGPILVDWEDKKCISRSNKIKAMMSIALSIGTSLFFMEKITVTLVFIILFFCGGACIFILTRKSE